MPGASRERVLESAVILVPLSLLTKASLIGRDLVAAYFFGATPALDAFLVADSIPRFLGSALLVGSFSMVFVPVLVEQLGGGDEREAWAMTSSLANITVLLLGSVSLASCLFAPTIVTAIAPGMTSEYQEMASALIRMLAVTTLLIGLAEVLRSVLYAQRSFLVPMIAVFLATLIAIAITVASISSIGIYSLALGAVVGAVARVAIQITSQRGKGARYQLVLHWRHPAIRKMALLFAGMSVMMGLNQLNTMATRYFASWLEPGSIAVYNYASLAETVLVDTFALSLITPLFPEMSSLASRGEMAEFRRNFYLALRTIALVLFPVIGLSVVFRTPAIAIVLERGAFTSQDTERVAAVYPFLAVAILVWGSGRIITFAFYALQQVRPLVIVTAWGVGLNIALDWLLVRPMGLAGLAVAASVGAIGGGVLAIWLLGGIVGWEDASAGAAIIAKIVFLSGILVTVAWLLFTATEYIPFSKGLWLVWGRIAVASSVSVAMYLVLLPLCGVRDFQLVQTALSSRLAPLGVSIRRRNHQDGWTRKKLHKLS